MTIRLTSLPPTRVDDMIRTGRAVLVDVREPDEFARGHVKGALSRPLSALRGPLEDARGREVVFMCKSGMRTAANCDRLAATVEGEAFVLDGGLDGWAAAGLPVVRG